MSKETVIGIDLGTGFSVVSIYENGAAKVIENAEGTRTTPSMVTYGETEISVGVSAKRQCVTNPKNTIYEVKRLIGRKFKDKEIQTLKKTLPYNLVEAKNGDVWVDINGKAISPQEISAEILRKMKKTAEDYLGYEVTKAVITVPAYFNDSQRSATKDAGTIAGLEVLRIINEPTAAILAMDVDSKISDDHKVMVIDTGSGTTDISIIEIANINGELQYEVLSTSGDSHLGGSDFDQKVINYLNDEFKKENSVDLLKDPVALQRLKLEAEKAKIELSSALQTTVSLPYITADASGPKHLNVVLTRAKFESMIDDLVDRTIAPCKIALKDAKLKMSDIVEVVLVGGTSRIPKVQEAVEKFTGKTLRKDVNVDECVSSGAAIQGGILAGDKTDVLLLDVTPLSLGIETAGGVFANLINKNTTIPTRHSQVFSTASDNQPAVTIRVAQGEREVFDCNKLLGEFTLDNITPAPRGVPQIEITLDIDANGILHVSAKDKATGKENKITIKSDSGLTEDEIKQMIRDGEENAESDKKFKILIEARNSAESIMHDMKKDLEEFKDKLTEDEISNIESAIQDVSNAWVGDDTEVIKSSVRKLYEVADPIFKIKSKEAEAAAETPSEDLNDDGSVDGEFTEA